MRRALLAAILLASSATIATPALAGGLTVSLDEVRTITFGQNVSTVYVGNPSVADINMIDSRHAFILGKGYGSTNIVALNDKGAQISNTRIDVQANEDRASTVVLNRGLQRETYSCTADHCEATPQPGDGKDAYSADTGQITAHQQTLATAARAP